MCEISAEGPLLLQAVVAVASQPGIVRITFKLNPKQEYSSILNVVVSSGGSVFVISVGYFNFPYNPRRSVRLDELLIHPPLGRLQVSFKRQQSKVLIKTAHQQPINIQVIQSIKIL